MSAVAARPGAGTTLPGLPARWYWDPAILDDELDRVFGRSWQVVCPAEDVARPGDRTSGRIGRLPVAVVRDGEGELRGFVNVCRHRGHPVVCEAGNGPLLQCPYHGWSYGLDGRVRAIPRCSPAGAEAPPRLALRPVAVDEWGGLVWANPDPDAPPLLATHAPLDALVRAKGIDLSAYEFVQRSAVTVEANWKAWVENAGECYHCPGVHRTTFADAWDVGEEAFELVEDGPVMAHFAPVRAGSRRFDGESNRFAYVYVFPGTFFTIDKSLLIAGTIVPLSATECEIVSLSHLARTADADELDRWMEMYGETLAEDIEVIRRQQEGLASRALDHENLVPATEGAILHFHALLRAALSR